MPTMAESPDAKAVLQNIKPTEVSAVDVPAIGEPHMVLKGMSNRLDVSKEEESDGELHRGEEPGYDANTHIDQEIPSDSEPETIEKQGGPMSDKKLDENAVPRPVMKVLHKRLMTVVDSVQRLSDVVKNLEVTETGADNPPQVVVDMTKSLAAEIRSFLPNNEVSVEKRGCAESVLSLADITKREEECEKAGAVSYLVRDRYVDIVQSVTEYMTTYVDGIEHDDAGPMLIPVGLDSTVDKAASELESLVDEYDAVEEPTTESDSEESDVAKSADMTIRDAFDQIMKALAETQAAVAVPPPIVGQTQESQAMEEETTTTTEETPDEMAADASETESMETSESEAAEATEPESTDEPVAKDDNLVLKAIEALEKKFDQKFEDVEKSVDDIRNMAKASDEKIDKAFRKRADSRGGAPDRTTKVVEKSNGKDEGSFSGVLGLRSAE